jgi:membrane fusion protein, heavy metal efflux system
MKAVLCISFLIFSLLGCKQEANTAAEAVESKGVESNTTVSLSDESIRNAGITTGMATFEMVSKTIRVNGEVDVPPQSLVSISFPLGGYLKSTDLLPGMHVNKGQIIALMEDQSYVQLQQDYLQSLSKLRLLKLDYERQKELREGDASSMKAFENALSEYEMQQVLVKSLSEKLKILGVEPAGLTIEKISRTVPVRSPIDGFVKTVMVNIGKYVNPSDVLFEIVDPRDIHAALTVFEKDYHLLKPGQEVLVRNAGRPEKTYRAEIILISRNIDSTMGAVVHCHFEGEHGDLLPGMYISAIIETEGQQLPTVPESAVVRHEGKHFVFTKQAKGTFNMAQVTIGDSKDGKIPLTANYIDWARQEIVLTGAYALLGKLMNVEEEE